MTQDRHTVPNETAGYLLADNQALPAIPRKQPRIPQPEPLIHLQTAEEINGHINGIDT